MAVTKELIDYFNASHFVLGNRRKGRRLMNNLATSNEAAWCAMLDALLVGDLGKFDTIDALAADSTAVGKVLGSAIASEIVSDSDYASGKILMSETALAYILSDPDRTAQNANVFAQAKAVQIVVGSADLTAKLVASSVALAAVYGSAEASAVLVASSSAMAKVAASSAAVSQMANSSTAMAKVLASTVALSALNGSSTAMGALKTYITANFSVSVVSKFSPGIGANAAQFSSLAGKKLSVAITGNGTHSFTCVGLGVDALTAGGKAGMTFVCDDCIGTNVMNSSNTTSGGWEKSAMRSWLSGTLLNNFPAELKSAIKAVNKKNTANYGAATTSDKLWLLSYTEVGLGGSEGTAYSVFNSNSARIRKNGSSAYTWWLRSVYSSSDFRYVYSDGTLSGYNASNTIGVVPGFCI